MSDGQALLLVPTHRSPSFTGTACVRSPDLDFHVPERLHACSEEAPLARLFAGKDAKLDPQE